MPIHKKALSTQGIEICSGLIAVNPVGSPLLKCG